MQDIFQRAWEETKMSYGLSWGTALRTLLSVSVGVGFVWLVLGQAEAMNEVTVYALYLLAGICAGFVPLFLWNLWLAPYKIVSERLDELAAARQAPAVVDEERRQQVKLHRKREEMRREMETLLRCIRSRQRRKFGSLGLRDPQGFDHTFLTLSEKYRCWLPNGVPETDLIPWVERIIATLKALDYSASKQRIERAVARGSWTDETT